MDILILLQIINLSVMIFATLAGLFVLSRKPEK